MVFVIVAVVSFALGFILGCSITTHRRHDHLPKLTEVGRKSMLSGMTPSPWFVEFIEKQNRERK